MLQAHAAFSVRYEMTATVHPAAPHHLPAFITAPGETDVIMVGAAIFLVLAVLAAGNFFLWLHTLPERMAHKSQKFQFEIVAVLGLLALFTHIHLFWVAALLLAFIDLPDFSTPLGRMVGAVEKIAGIDPPAKTVADAAHDGHGHGAQVSKEEVAQVAKNEPAAVPPPKELAKASGRS
jgi:hypothetical protein